MHIFELCSESIATEVLCSKIGVSNNETLIFFKTEFYIG